MNSFQGHFLVAAAHQLDPNFARAVILVVGHTKRAAFGVIVNDSTEEHSRRQQCNSRMPSLERRRSTSAVQ